MIRSFRHAGLERFFLTGSKAGIQPSHAKKLRLQLFALDRAVKPSDMDAPGWTLHALKGDLADHFSVAVNGNWRVTFRFDGEDATVVDYGDYHLGERTLWRCTILLIRERFFANTWDSLT